MVESRRLWLTFRLLCSDLGRQALFAMRGAARTKMSAESEVATASQSSILLSGAEALTLR